MSGGPGATHLILGAAKSGKSAHAESLVTSIPGPYLYVATAQALDAEMVERIRVHRERRGPDWETIEEPLNIVEALRNYHSERPVLLDCLTLWITNLLLFPGAGDPERRVLELCEFLSGVCYPIYLVANEVGAGIVPENALARRFRDLAGFANQRVAAACGSVTLVVAGIPLRLKG